MVAFPQNTSWCYWDHPIQLKRAQFLTPKNRIQNHPQISVAMFIFSSGLRKLGRLWMIPLIYFFRQHNGLKAQKMKPDIEWPWCKSHIHCLTVWLQPSKSWPRGETCTATLIYIADDAAELFQKYSVCKQTSIAAKWEFLPFTGIRKKKYMPTSWWSFKPSVWNSIMPSPIDHVQKVQRNPRVWSGKSYPCRIDW